MGGGGGHVPLSPWICAHGDVDTISPIFASLTPFSRYARSASTPEKQIYRPTLFRVFSPRIRYIFQWKWPPGVLKGFSWAQPACRPFFWKNVDIGVWDLFVWEGPKDFWPFIARNTNPARILGMLEMLATKYFLQENATRKKSLPEFCPCFVLAEAFFFWGGGGGGGARSPAFQLMRLYYAGTDPGDPLSFVSARAHSMTSAKILSISDVLGAHIISLLTSILILSIIEVFI